MKKLLSFALVLAMVAVLAAPALAITGTVVKEPTAGDAKLPYTNGAFIFIVSKPTSAATLVSAAEVVANKSYVNYENLYWKLSLTTNYNAYNAATNPNGTTLNAADYATPGVKLTSDVATFANDLRYFTITTIGVTEQTTSLNQAVASTGRTYTFDIPRTGITTNTNYVFIGSATVDKTSPNPGYMKCELLGRKGSAAFKNPGLDFPGSNGDDTIYSTINGYSGEKLYSLSGSAGATQGTMTVKIEKGDYKDYQVLFTTDGKTYGNNVTGISVNAGGTTFVLVHKVAGQWYVGLTVATDPSVKNLFAAYNQVMNFFGFNQDAEGTLLGKHFAAKLSVYYAAITKPINIWTALVTVPDTTVPPKTGDNASVLGFVMVAAALVAAVAMGYKKVRE